MLKADFDWMLREHLNTFNSIDEASLQHLVDIIRHHPHNKTIVGLGAGRMGYSLQAFIMRLSHIGYNAYMIGDTTLPRVRQGDLVLINSSSGQTPSIALFAKQAKDHGAYVVLITATHESSIEKLSDFTVHYSASSDSQLMKSTNEQFSFLFFDYIAHRLVIEQQLDVKKIEMNHSILE